ncbi:MAG: deiodinase family protein, partial [Planctomycetaceae bacterium]|nr:deiodinase family protein [Planctomycetaceae bacterium]
MLSLLLCVAGTAITLQAEELPSKAERERPKLSDEARQVADELQKSLQPGTEARAMLDCILEGTRMAPDEGWFRLAKSQSRYGWSTVQELLDSNDDQRVTRKEFSGTEEEFSRLDRDSNGILTEGDFAWSDSSTTRTPGYLMFFQADRNANGKITADEFAELFDSLDTSKHGYLSLDDLRSEFIPPTEQERRASGGGPDMSTLVLGLKRQEIGSLQSGPELGAQAPDFTLTSLSGETVTLSKEIGKKPVVLIFGNFTCGPFRSQSGNIEKLYLRYRDRAKFFLVYVREAHPADGWSMSSNERAGIDVFQPQNNESRRHVAETCRERLDLDIPMLVDSVDDAVGATYSGMPNRLYLIDESGQIAFKNGRGPFGFHPRQLEQALILHLMTT